MMQPGPGKMNDAMIKAVRAQVFARPLRSLASPWDQMQARQGQRGAPGGVAQGYVGGSIPQDGGKQASGRAAAPTSTPSPTNPTNAPGTPQQGNGGLPQGLEALLPLLAFALPHFLSMLGSGGGIGGGGGLPMLNIPRSNGTI